VISRLGAGGVAPDARPDAGHSQSGFTYVDVRDVADLHLRAMVSPQAAGERFIAASEFLWMGEVAEILRAHFGPRAAKVPKRRIPDFVVRGIALFDRPLASVLSALSNRSEYSGAKARRVLDWKPRPAREAIIDCAESLLEKGLCEAAFTRFHSIPLTRKGPTHLSSTPTAPSSRRYHEANLRTMSTAEAASASNGIVLPKSCIITLLYRLRALRNDHKPLM